MRNNTIDGDHKTAVGIVLILAFLVAWFIFNVRECNLGEYYHNKTAAAAGLCGDGFAGYHPCTVEVPVKGVKPAVMTQPEECGDSACSGR